MFIKYEIILNGSVFPLAYKLCFLDQVFCSGSPLFIFYFFKDIEDEDTIIYNFFSPEEDSIKNIFLDSDRYHWDLLIADSSFNSEAIYIYFYWDGVLLGVRYVLFLIVGAYKKISHWATYADPFISPNGSVSSMCGE